MRALLHIHTTFSYDGELTPESVVAGAGALGAGAVFITDHIWGMSGGRYEELVRRARDLSDETLAVIPGLEVRVSEGGDLLALGVTELPGARDICSLADEIHEQGGVAVLSHPGRSRRLSPEAFRKLDGIEVWNGLHDSKYFPSGPGLAILKGGRRYNRRLFGCCGLDLHAGDGWFPLYLQTEGPTAAGPLAALKSGAFTYGRRGSLFGSEWLPNPPALAALMALTFAYRACAFGVRLTGRSLPRSLTGALRKRAGGQ